MLFRITLFTLSVLFCLAKLNAAPIVTPLDQVNWRYDGNNFICSLSTDVNNFGEISLVKVAGYPLEIKSNSVLYQQDIIHYRFGASPAPWGEKSLPESNWFHSLQSINQQKKRPFRQQLVTDVISLLQALQQGIWGHINFVFASKEQIHLVLPAVNRGLSFKQFYHCISELAPYSYEQVRDRNFNFAVNEYLLSKQQQDDMQLTAQYIAMAPDITKILIDGHSDSSGSIAENLRLSQQRADDLYTHLLEAGVDGKLIEVRSHGDRFPLAKNTSAKGRQKNRRVNLRIIKKR